MSDQTAQALSQQPEQYQQQHQQHQQQHITQPMHIQQQSPGQQLARLAQVADNMAQMQALPPIQPNTNSQEYSQEYTQAPMAYYPPQQNYSLPIMHQHQHQHQHPGYYENMNGPNYGQFVQNMAPIQQQQQPPPQQPQPQPQSQSPSRQQPSKPSQNSSSQQILQPNTFQSSPPRFEPIADAIQSAKESAKESLEPDTVAEEILQITEAVNSKTNDGWHLRDEHQQAVRTLQRITAENNRLVALIAAVRDANNDPITLAPEAPPRGPEHRTSEVETAYTVAMGEHYESLL